MIEWTYAQVDTKCGRCDTVLTIGDAMQLTHITGVKRALVRCTECAGPAPADLPPFVLAPAKFDRPVEILQTGRKTPPPEWMPYRE